MGRLHRHHGPPGVDTRLVRAAQGRPRQLIRLGNRLLETQVQLGPRAPKLSATALDRVLGPLPDKGRS